MQGSRLGLHIRLWPLVVAMAVGVWLHYAVAPEELLGLFTSLAFLPVVYAAVAFGLRGGLGASLATGLALVPHFAISHHGPEQVTEIGMVVIFVVAGGVIGWHVDRGRKQRQREAMVWARLAAAQEEERQRIARELHDDTIQHLISLGRCLEAAADQGGLPPPLAGELSELRRRSQAILDGVRRFSRDLRPSVVDDLGLVPAIEGLAGQHSLPVQVEVQGPPRRLAPEAEVALFRIVQEALSNAGRHSGARQVTVTVTFAGRRVRLTVADDGRGFSAPRHLGDLAREGKLGLLGMQERAQLLGGAFHISSQPGRGTTITVEVEA